MYYNKKAYNKAKNYEQIKRLTSPIIQTLTGSGSTGMPSRACAFATERTRFSRWFLVLSFCKNRKSKWITKITFLLSSKILEKTNPFPVDTEVPLDYWGLWSMVSHQKSYSVMAQQNICIHVNLCISASFTEALTRVNNKPNVLSQGK